MKNIIFTYGTLKRREPNYRELHGRQAEFLCEVVTVDKWPLIIASDLNLPFLLRKKGHGKHVHGELYAVDDKTVEFLDWFEGVDQDLYTVFQIDVREKETGKVRKVPAYMLDDFNPNLLNCSTVYFESYSSNNPHFGKYVIEEDSMEEDSTEKLKRQVKKNFED